MESGSSDIFRMSRSALSYAKERTAHLESEVDRLFKGKPHTVFTDPNTESGGKIVKIQLPSSIPDQFTHIAFDVLNQCRAVLDRAAYALAVADGKTGKIKAGFPFADDVSNLTGRRPESYRDIPTSIYNYMVSLKPYEAGYYNLWALNKACNFQKHRMLVPTVIFPQGFIITDIRGIISEINRIINGWDAEKNELAVLELKPSQELNYNFQLTLRISFDQVDGIGTAPVIPVLYDCISMVEGILSGIEAEARRTGLIS